MKILAIEQENEGIVPEQFKPHFKNEASAVWNLYKNGTFREIYFTTNGHNAVIMLECGNEEEAAKILSGLPLVKEGLISFALYPLTAYNGFERLFDKQS